MLLAVLAWLGMFCLIVLGSLEYRPPGDGGSGLPGLQIYLWGALVSVLSLAFGCVAASLLAWRLRRGRTGAVIAAGLLVLLAVVLLVPSLTERKLRVFEDDAYLSIDLQQKILTLIRKRTGAPEAGQLPVTIDERSFEQGDALKAEIESFLDCIRTGKPSPAGIDIAATAALTAIMGRDAIYSKGVKTWKEMGVEI